jgi:hypothetical protein
MTLTGSSSPGERYFFDQSEIALPEMPAFENLRQLSDTRPRGPLLIHDAAVGQHGFSGTDKI